MKTETSTKTGTATDANTVLAAEKLNCDKLRKRMLNWHYQKCNRIGIIELLESDYQRFRVCVKQRVGRDIDFREAIKLAVYVELTMLEQIRDEKRLGI